MEWYRRNLVAVEVSGLMLFAVTALFLFVRFSEWYSKPIEVPLPRSEEITSIVAMLEPNELEFLVPIPSFELPLDVGLRLIDCLRPAIQVDFGDHERKFLAKFSPLRLIVHHQNSQTTQIEIMVCPAKRDVLMRVNGIECGHNGPYVPCGPLEEDSPIERYSIDQGCCAYGIVLTAWNGLCNDEDNSQSLEESLFNLEVSTGHRSVEELDAWREKHPGNDQ